ncbi:hypothetical protein CcaverHIS002_0101600 [Cutaneotrichosporon cavernicola]|uniref:Uncharacterized protein n=1 Tax=Cutaneotrichosporon cavernicola TaxID=279322 RepID=A0AA48KWR5_9TREE|nr:uncharacterized protein CcaverHIS019_0101570 [Cutaneotrichosporon cavernicola]BEI79631.1 hypothetical protein CcaverHIS002_0101600 [Cutaneotrichosporon cavernicola]BEI87439.1 hypothetical protein CcaverHIS019_0101570 [Cutaneotrichosporon cavernicola]BEI95208.1 hypothetical protein CcaverHIS631_0101570 [Cutaneotrichosporon cavernicola]BEJ02981.1 hypothetical protein CcaverHIS641_0101560 [Cutaneotrichosporon cavernicola]
MLFISLLFLALLGPTSASASQALFTFPNLNVTYYYDHANFPYHPACDAAAGGPGWAKPTNEGASACGQSVKELNTNAVVAMNVTWLNSDGYASRLENLCGREVQIWKDGVQIKMKGGPFFLWEGCQACASLPRIDLSLNAYIAATGDKECHRGTVGSYDVYVMDNFVRRASAGRITLNPSALLFGLAFAAFI